MKQRLPPRETAFKRGVPPDTGVSREQLSFAAFAPAAETAPQAVKQRRLPHSLLRTTPLPIRIRPITLWRADVDNQPGALAQTLEPLATAGADLQIVMGYRLPGDRARAAIEVAPVAGARVTSAAEAAGLSEATISALQVEGDNRAGLGHAIAKALGDAGINIDFLLAQVSGSRHTTVIGFESREDADRAIPLIEGAAATSGRPAVRKAARKGGRSVAKGARKAARRRR